MIVQGVQKKTAPTLKDCLMCGAIFTAFWLPIVAIGCVGHSWFETCGLIVLLFVWGCSMTGIIDSRNETNKCSSFVIDEQNVEANALPLFYLERYDAIMIVDGKKLAEEIKESLKEEVARLGKKLRLAVIQVGANLVSEKFLEQKKKFGGAVGVDVRVYQLPADISTNTLRKKLAEAVHIKQNSGVIVQLPLPKQIQTQYILAGIVPEKDPDMLSSKSIGLFATGRSSAMPPVVGAVKYIFEKYNIDVKGKNVLFVGAGRLVGKPLALWLLQQDCALVALNKHTSDLAPFTLNADIIISGAGAPGLIQPDMVKSGVVVIDAGTSESAPNGHLVGDCDPRVAEKSSFFTPVLGGVGPLVVAKLFQNIVVLARK